MTESHPAPALVAEEAPCRDCIRDMGLCHFHARHELPQLKEPSWPQMIGDGYVCENAGCLEHLVCLDRLGAAAPRAACLCHNCAQRRAWSKAQTKASRGVVHSPAFVAAQERKRTAQRQSRRKPTDRLARAVQGKFTRSTRSTSSTRSQSRGA